MTNRKEFENSNRFVSLVADKEKDGYVFKSAEQAGDEGEKIIVTFSNPIDEKAVYVIDREENCC